MSNPWGVKLRPSGLKNRLDSEQSSISDLEQRQNELRDVASSNSAKQNMYEERQSSLAADAMAGQQGRLNGQGGKKKSRKHKKTTRKHRKHRKTRRHHKRH
jgi:hypothetical protein